MIVRRTVPEPRFEDKDLGAKYCSFILAREFEARIIKNLCTRC